MKKIGVRIETFMGAGRYQHNEYDIGINARNRDEAISNGAVDLLRKAVERVYDEMPVGSKDLTAVIQYKRLRRV